MKSLVSLTFCLALSLLVGCSISATQPIKNTTNFPIKIAKDSPNEIQQNVNANKPASVTIVRPVDYSNCGLNDKARELARLIAQDSEQQRAVIKCNEQLAKIAAEKAREMAQTGTVTHKGKYGGPNLRLQQKGYVLQETEQLQFNTVEAIMGGEEFADEVWISFQTSYSHKTHLLAELAYYEGQSQLGVDYFRKLQSPHVDYWVVYFAKESHE